MAVDKVIVQYEADISKLKQNLDSVEKSMTKVEKSAVKSSKAIETASEKRAFLIDKEIKRLEVLKKQRADAFSPRRIRVFNQQIKNSEENLKLLRGQFDKNAKQSSLFGNQLKRIGVLAAGAFAVSRIVAFGKASVKAFDEQQKAENRLLTALGNREDVQEALLKQASELQKLTIFGDQDVIAAQSLIAAFTEEEAIIKDLTRVTLDFATAKGFELPAAAELVSKTFASSTNSLTRYGIQVEGAAGSSERLESITTNLDAAFKGQAEAALAGAGKLQQLENRFGDLQERLGGLLLEGLSPFIDGVGAFVEISIGFIDALTGANRQLEDMDSNLENIANRTILSSEQIDNLEDGLKILEERNKILEQGRFVTEADEEAIRERIQAERDLINEEKQLQEVHRESIRNVFLLTEKIKALTDERKAEGTTVGRILQINELLVPLQAELNTLLGKQTDEAKESDKAFTKLSKTLDKEFSEAVKKASSDVKEFIELTKQQGDEASNFFAKEVDTIISNNIKIAQLSGDRIAEEEAVFQQRLNNLQSNLDAEGNITEASQKELELLIKEHEQNITRIELDEIEARENAKVAIIKNAGAITLNLIRSIGGQKATASKSFALFEIALSEAVAIAELVKDVQKVGVTPVEKIALFLGGIAQITSGIAQAKTILNSDPVPAFAEGVIGFKGEGTSTSDSNLIRISNKESVIKAKASDRYPDELRAANEMRLEEHIYDKYIIPYMKQQEPYDDYRVWRAVKKNKSVRIENVGEFANSMSESAYLNNRYPN